MARNPFASFGVGPLVSGRKFEEADFSTDDYVFDLVPRALWLEGAGSLVFDDDFIDGGTVVETETVANVQASLLIRTVGGGAKGITLAIKDVPTGDEIPYGPLATGAAGNDWKLTMISGHGGVSITIDRDGKEAPHILRQGGYIRF